MPHHPESKYKESSIIADPSAKFETKSKRAGRTETKTSAEAAEVKEEASEPTGGLLPYMSYIGRCRGIGYGF